MEATKEKLVGDFRILLRDAEELLRATAHDAGEKAAAARKHIEKSLEEGKKSLSEAEDIVLDKGRDAAKAAEAYVKENPWGALGIAAGVGLILGLLIHRG